jgi:hypothetical protein
MPQQAVMARGIPATFGAGPARFGPAVKSNCHCVSACRVEEPSQWKGFLELSPMAGGGVA